MDQSQRQSEILSLLQSEGMCSVLDLAKRFGVSDETVRRDIKHLEGLGHVAKVHGGVRLPDNILEANFRQRQIQNVEAKRLIGELAASLVIDGMTLFIDGSTTALWVARHLNTQRNLSIVTNGVEVARELCNRNNNRIFLAGGQLSDDYLAAFGPSAVDFISKFSPELAFIGVAGIDSGVGYCDAHLPEAELAGAVLPLARQSVIVADHSKFENRSLIQVCPMGAPDVLVCDRPPPTSLLDAMGGTVVMSVED